MIGHSIGALMMMRLGSFSFGINTAAYQALRRSTEYSWAAQERFGRLDALQNTGPGADTITLNGVILPAFRGGTGQIERLRSLAATGQPQLLVSGLGQIMGRWVIEKVEEDQEVFAAAGIPRRQEFTVQLKKYGGCWMLEYITSDGDTADSIAWRHYGTTQHLVVERLLDANKGLAEYGGVLPAGLRIILPQIEIAREVRTVKLWD